MSSYYSKFKYNQKLKIILILFLTLGYNSNAQENNYIIKKTSKTTAVLMSNGKVIDSIATDGFKSKNSYVEIVGNNVYIFESRLVGSSDFNFGKTYILIFKWSVVNNKFEYKKYKFILGHCKVNRMKFEIIENQIYWCYRKSIFKRIKGVITDNDIENSKNFRFSCE